MPGIGFQSITELNDLIITQYQIKFNEALQSAANFGNAMTTEFTTRTRAGRIPFIDRWEALTQFGLQDVVDTVDVLGDFITQEIEKWAKGISISKFDWEDPMAQSVLMSQLDGLVGEAAVRRTRAVARALNLGDTPIIPAYDSEPLFSHSHVVNGYPFDNLLEGVPLTPEGFNLAINRLNEVPLGSDGAYLPMDSAEYHLIVPTQQWMNAFLAIESETIYESGFLANNPFYKKAKIWRSSFLTDPNDWFVAATMPGITPFATIRHVTSTGALIPRIAPEDPNVIERNEYLWNLELDEVTAAVHFYQLVKATQS